MSASAPLWTGLGLIGPLNARFSGGSLPSGATGISIDTRTLAPGDLFFAISGENSDGHDYARAAFEKGAAAAVIDETHADALRGLGPVYVVHDVLVSLQSLGRAGRRRTTARVAAITGSVGKTSTKEALRLVLTQAGAVHASAASYNNHWGVPLSLARMPKATRFGIFEIGMNHADEITPLAAMVAPDVAVVTTVAAVHLEHFADVEGIADAKAEIFSGLAPGGLAIINHDIPYYDRLLAAARVSPAGHVASFGAHAQADARLIDIEPAADHAMVHAEICGKALSYRLGAPGRHLAMNSLAVLLVAKSFGLDVEAAAVALAFFEAQAGRGQQIALETPDGPFTLIDESYNANPVSMRAALALTGDLPAPESGRRIAVLGDMLELGASAASLHAELADAVEAHNIDLVFAAGPLMKSLYDRLPPERRGAWHLAAGDLEAEVTDSVHAGDIVVVKGSNGSRMRRVVDALRARYAPAAPEGIH